MARTTHTQSINISNSNSHCGNITGNSNNTYFKSDGMHRLDVDYPQAPRHAHQQVGRCRGLAVGNKRVSGVEVG